MKFFLAIATIAATVSTSSAFTATLPKAARATTMMAHPDSADLVQEAMKVTEEFGATSTEARLAWETVEEVDASDNTAASMGSLADECETEVVKPECVEYGEKLDELQGLVAANAFPDDSSISKELAGTVGQVKFPKPEKVRAPNSAALDAALEEAKAVTADKGIKSPEAAVAWETVEEIAAAGNANALGETLTDFECVVEAAKEACVALEELGKITEA